MAKLPKDQLPARNARMAALAGKKIFPHIVYRDDVQYVITGVIQQGDSCPFWICERRPKADDMHDAGLVLVLDSDSPDWWM